MSHPHAADEAAAVDDWPPHAPETFQEVDRLGRVATGLLALVTVAHLFSTWSDWKTYGVVHKYLGGLPGVDDAALDRADSIARLTSVPFLLVSVAAAVVFVLWVWRARLNSEVFCQADHRHSHGWVIGGWICPGVNLVYPKRILDDVWVASDPATPVWAEDLQRHRRTVITTAWWTCWAGAMILDIALRRVLMWVDPTVPVLRAIAVASTVSLILTAVSTGLAAAIIRKLSAMQTTRPWAPWWDQREGSEQSAAATYSEDRTGGRSNAGRHGHRTDVAPADLAAQAARPRPVPAPVTRPVAPVVPLRPEPAAEPLVARREEPSESYVSAAASLSLQSSPPLNTPVGWGAAEQQSQQDEEQPVWSPFSSVVAEWQDEIDSTSAASYSSEPTYAEPAYAAADRYAPDPNAGWDTDLPTAPRPVEEFAAADRSWSGSAEASRYRYEPAEEQRPAPALPAAPVLPPSPPRLSVVPPLGARPAPSAPPADNRPGYGSDIPDFTMPAARRARTPDYLSPSAPIPAPAPAPRLVAPPAPAPDPLSTPAPLPTPPAPLPTVASAALLSSALPPGPPPAPPAPRPQTSAGSHGNHAAAGRGAAPAGPASSGPTPSGRHAAPSANQQSPGGSAPAPTPRTHPRRRWAAGPG